PGRVRCGQVWTDRHTVGTPWTRPFRPCPGTVPGHVASRHGRAGHVPGTVPRTCRDEAWPGSAEAVRAREAFRQEADQQRDREADDVQVVALDRADERRTQALDRVGAGAALPLAARDVVAEITRRQRPEGHPGRRVLEHLPP